MKTSLKDTIKRSFLKCVISNKLDNEEDHLINICDLEDYEMPAPEKEFHLLSDEERDDSSVKSKMSYDEGNADKNFSSKSSCANLSSKDC